MYSIQMALAQLGIPQKPVAMLTAREMLDSCAPRPVRIITAAANSGHCLVKVVDSGVSNSTVPQIDPVDSPLVSTPSTPTGEVYDTSTFCVGSPSISPRTPTTPRTPGRSPTARRSPTAVYVPPPQELDLTGLDPQDLDDVNLEL